MNKSQQNRTLNKETWTNARLSKMNLHECIAQLLHIPAWSNRGTEHETSILELIEKYGVGGIIFFQGTPQEQAAITNNFQAASDIPLMISMDAEWGLGMRLDNTPSFPYQMTLGALQNDDLIYEMGAEIARQCRRIGVHVNFAPVVDVNSNPANPVIGFRSFGDDKIKVTEKALAYINGLQDNGVMACAKHFPGHGDTNLDSHFALPAIDKSIEELETLEWYPFKKLVEKGIQSVMMGHLFLPKIDNRKHYASSISKPAIDLLRKKLGFDGLLFTDALDMKSVANHFAPGQLELEALKAGNDVLLFVKDVPAAIEAIEKGVRKGIISEKDIFEKCEKLLNAKFDLGLSDIKPISLEGIHEDLHSEKSININQQVAHDCLTVLGELPDLSEKKIAAIALSPEAKASTFSEPIIHHTIEKTMNNNDHDLTTFQITLNGLARKSGAEVSHFENVQELNLTGGTLKNFDTLIVSIHGLKLKNIDHFGLTFQMKEILQKLAAHPNVVICLFGNPYLLNEFYPTAQKACPVIITYQENRFTQEETAKLLFGNDKAVGQLPVCLNLMEQ